MPDERIRGYVLAGGLSTRMGESKAALRLAGKTMLQTALETMREVTSEICVVGPTEEVPPGIPHITDRFSGCGPMGGMEAALQDCVAHGCPWAVFLPVDAPLLPGRLLRALVELWTSDAETWVGLPVVEGRLQPLTSALHVELLPMVQASLERGEYRVQPLLRAAARELARRKDTVAERAFRATELRLDEDGVMADGERLPWSPSAGEWARRAQWFANANTPEEMERIRTIYEKQGPSGELSATGRHLRRYP